ncbi:NACHT domain-containing protein [Streptomyces sp. NPDC054808]
MASLTPDEFEEEVRRVARALWPTEDHSGPEMVDGREVDLIINTEEVSHMVEATMWEKTEKAHNVGPKLAKHLAKARRDGYLADAWFVTYHPPTAHQRQVLHEQYDKQIKVVSFQEFRSRIVNAKEYLELRDLVGWGSASNPLNNSSTDLIKYVPLKLSLYAGKTSNSTPRNRRTERREEKEVREISITELVKGMESEYPIALLGDYGAGKSMTLREVHTRLKKQYLKGASHVFPVTLSLRRHFGQYDPAEALTRHAKYLGFSNPPKLVSAWRNGFVHVLLDGFDELAAPGWSGSTEAIRENRKAATDLIAQFSQERPDGSGLIVAGRRFYFDTLDELGKCLFGGNPHMIASISDFSPDQARSFLEQFKQSGAIPDWLPQRPLLLGHLAAAGVLQSFDESEGLAPAPGWNWLLDKISERESFIKQGVDGQAVRQVIEQLAEFARQTPLGIGPVTMQDIVSAFSIVRKQPPSDRELTLLQRIPGIGGVEEDAENGTRRFVDADLASAAQAAHVVRFVLDPYGEYPGFNPKSWKSGMEPLGVEVAAESLQDRQVQPGMVSTALSRAVKTDSAELAADIVGIAICCDFDLSATAGPILTIGNAVVPSIEISEDGPDLSSVQFSDCLISEVVFSGNIELEKMPAFSGCAFTTIVGRLGEAEMAPEKFQDCSFDEFPDSVDRVNEIMKSDILEQGTRVVMTLLRKLYMQRGRGRKDSGLTRGMTPSDAALVPKALQLLQQERLTTPTRQGKNRIWLPDRSAGPRVRHFLSSPRVGDDPLIALSRSLSSGKN